MRHHFLRRLVFALTIYVGIVVGFATEVKALECGDMDADCAVTATDALRVLRRSVGLNGELLCGCSGICSSNATNVSVDCFDDEYCAEQDPAKPYCDANDCSECSMDEHCGQDMVCDHALLRCMPACAYQ